MGWRTLIIMERQMIVWRVLLIEFSLRGKILSREPLAGASFGWLRFRRRQELH